MIATRNQRHLQVLSHGARLMLLAKTQSEDVNEAYLMVHRVMARAMQEGAVPETESSLENALACSLHPESAPRLPKREPPEAPLNPNCACLVD